MATLLKPDLVKPAYFNHPEYTQTLGPEVCDLAVLAGFAPDPEQELALSAMFALDPKRRTLSGQVATAAFEFGVVCARQNMKALATSTPMLTARGWVTMVDLKVGDQVFHPAGHMVAVTHVSDVKLGRQCYRVTTSDGRAVIADAGHLWTVLDRAGHRGAWRTVTTADIALSGVERSPTGQRSVTTDGVAYRTSEFRYRLPVQEPPKSADAELPIDPYLLGAWLGDGKSNGASLSSHADDVGHWAAEIERCGFIPTVHHDRTCSTVGITTQPGVGRHGRSLAGALRRMGVLGNKHVPDSYWAASATQREALLQGLMDTDGTIHARSGQATFTTTRRQLADAAVYLVRSLGWRASVKEGRAILDGRDCGPKFCVAFTPKSGDPFAPFRLPRKAERVQSVDGGKGRFTVSIKSVEPVPTVPVCCIKVDSPDGLFLAGRDLVATHNTGLFKQAALGWLYVTDQELSIWSAHELDTTDQAFEDMVNLITDTPALSKRLDPDFGKEPGIKRGNGKQIVKLRPSPACRFGQALRFKARTLSGGRGLTGNKVILDEAMYLQQGTMDSLVPTLSAVDDPQLVYGGSAGLPKSKVWRGVRDRGRPGGDQGLAYMEFCSQPEENACEDEACDHALGVEGCALDDVEYIRQANPALERRISIDYIRAERRTLAANPLGYGRERAGWWDPPDDEATEPLIKPDMWTNLADPLSEPLDPVAFGVYVNISRTSSAIGVVGRRADGKFHVGIVPAVRGKSIDSLPGTAWIPDRVKELVEQWKPCAVVIDGHSAAASLITTIEGLGVEVVTSNATDLAKACGCFHDAVTADKDTAASLRHRGAGPLFRSVTSAKKRDLSDQWAWDRKDKDSDITQLMAVTLGLHGLIVHGQPEKVEVWGFLS